MQEKIKEYYELNKQKLNAEDVLKKLNKELKKELKGKGEVLTEDGIVAVVNQQVRRVMDEENLADLLIEKGFEEAIEWKPVPKKEKVEELAYKGKIDPEDLELCIIEKPVEVLLIGKRDKTGKIKPR